MSSNLPRLFLARHGDTAWTDSHQHTGRTDLELNERGVARAGELAERLRGFTFTRVLTSPLKRASMSCRIAGFGDVAETNADLVEWDYGQYEGLRTDEILAVNPGWELFRDGCPGGESPQDVVARADRVVALAREAGGDVLAFSSGHIIRMIAARWLKLTPLDGRCFFCRPASVGILAFEHGNLDEPVISLWNYVRHPWE